MFQHTAKTPSLEAMARCVKKSGTIREPIEAPIPVNANVICSFSERASFFQKVFGDVWKMWLQMVAVCRI